MMDAMQAKYSGRGYSSRDGGSKGNGVKQEPKTHESNTAGTPGWAQWSNKGGPIGGKEKGATWEHIAGPMDLIHQDSITQAIIVRRGVMATRSEQQSTRD